MLAYLSSINASQTAAMLKEELSFDNGFDDVTRKKYEGLLARKWTNVMRLQRKVGPILYCCKICLGLNDWQILDLESRITSLESELECVPSIDYDITPTSWLPGSQPKHKLVSHRAPISRVAFHPVRPSIASASDDSTIKIWDWEIGALERTLKGHLLPVRGLDFGGPEGQTLLASCSSDLTVKLWDPNKGYANVRTLVGHEHSVSTVRFLTHNGCLLVSAGRDGSIRIWDVLTGYCVKTIYTEGQWIHDVSSSFDGVYLVSGGKNRTATVWEASSGHAKTELPGHVNDIECCAFAPPASFEYMAAIVPTAALSLRSSAFIATGSRDKTIKLWNDRGNLIKTLVGHDNWVRGLAFHPGGRYLVSVGDDRTIRCWDLSRDAELVKTIDEPSNHFVSCIQWGPKQLHRDQGISYVLATGSADACVRVWM